MLKDQQMPLDYFIYYSIYVRAT